MQRARRVCFLLALLLSACSGGVAEFQTYSLAFELQNVEAQTVLDRLARDEREVWRAVNDQQRTPTFSADNARYYVDVGDPPLTGSIRETLAIVHQFNQVLVALSDGTRANVVSNQILAIAANAAQTADAFDAIAGLSLGPSEDGLSSIATGVGAPLALIEPALQAGLSGGARREFRRILVEAYPHLRATLVALRPASEAIYRVYLAQNIATNAPRSEQLADREMIAGWVILIDGTLEAMDAAVAASQDTSSTARISQMLNASIELRVLAETLRNARQQ